MTIQCEQIHKKLTK